MQKTQIENFRALGAFWQHFGIHKRKSDYSGKNIISVFSDECPYPVWHKDEWMENANPPSAIYDKNRDFWEQVWELFRKCPIAHNVWVWNENSEYTDDCWYSKNCYLCHSLLKCEDCSYLFRTVNHKDCQFCVFSFDLQKCLDIIYWFDCYNVKYAIDVKRCRNSAFLFDCEDCENCMLCWNLRNKKYCIANKQYSKEDYEKEIQKYDLSSRKIYNTLIKQFSDVITKKAYWKEKHFTMVENSSWDYLENCNNCENCFYIQEAKDCKNWLRSLWVKSSQNFVSILHSEKIYNSVLAQDNCYNIHYCFNVIESKNLEYCSNCYRCENCFLSSWLVWKKYYILNKEYSKEDYEKLKQEIIEDMKKKWVYWEFFPWYFSPTTYEESWAASHCPLSLEEQKKYGFRISQLEEKLPENLKNISELPEKLLEDNIWEVKWWYFDEIAKKPFAITDTDIAFYKKTNSPINDKFYIRRLKENFSWMFPTAELRTTKCSISWKKIQTTLPKKLDSRIVSLEEYGKMF